MLSGMSAITRRNVLFLLNFSYVKERQTAVSKQPQFSWQEERPRLHVVWAWKQKLKDFQCCRYSYLEKQEQTN